MKKTLLIAVLLAAASCLSGCMVATCEEYRPGRHHHSISSPFEETIVVVPAPGSPPGPYWRHPHRRAW